ncbi:MAG: hypothetical protein EXQ48_03670 [Acidobacteria bacterium]|nr:hypothetical protein [Acidobacteriota bacterium]
MRLPGRLAIFVAVALCLTTSIGMQAQGQGQGRGRAGGAPAPAPTPRTTAPIDLTGTWVAIISEDWRWRMVTPAKGDYASIPINAEGKRVADLWDPAKDEAAGEQCRAYGAPGLMRGPTRLRVAWLDDNTLKLETDYGMQTRLFPFRGGAPAAAAAGAAAPAAGAPAWQGVSTAQWVMAAGGGRGGPRYGSMKSVTTRLKPGYLRKNGVPYSANAVFTEYWDVQKERNGDQYMVVTNVVDDPTYLQGPWITSLHFKKEPDGSKWDPTPCDARF